VRRTALDTDTLTRIERLDFADHHLALDLDGNAGTVAKLLGAVFGRDAVHSASYVAIGLQLLDAGMSTNTLASLALGVRLGGAPSNEDIVKTLYTNVVGVAPDAGALAFYSQMLNDGSVTSANLALIAANTQNNLTGIGFDALWGAGLVYS
jgi:hypothetical protein